MNALMKLISISFLALALPAVAVEDEKVRGECDRKGEEAGNKAVAEAVLRNPADVTKVQEAARQRAVNACLAGKGRAVGKVRAK